MVGSMVGSMIILLPSRVPVLVLLLPVALSLSGLSELLVTSFCLFSLMTMVFPSKVPVFRFPFPAALLESGERELETMSSRWLEEDWAERRPIVMVLPSRVPVLVLELPAALLERGERELEMMSSMWEPVDEPVGMAGPVGMIGRRAGAARAVMEKRGRRARMVVEVCIVMSGGCRTRMVWVCLTEGKLSVDCVMREYLDSGGSLT